jgi:hypothetical protein
MPALTPASRRPGRTPVASPGRRPANGTVAPAATARASRVTWAGEPAVLRPDVPQRSGLSAASRAAHAASAAPVPLSRSWRPSERTQ